MPRRSAASNPSRRVTTKAAARALNASATARAPIPTALGPTHGPRRLGVPNYERTVNFSLGEPLGLPEMPAAPSGSRRRSLDGELWREGGGEAGRRPCTLTGRGVDHVRLRAAARRDRAGARSRPRRRAAARERSRPGGARGPRVRRAPEPVATGRLHGRQQLTGHPGARPRSGSRRAPRRVTLLRARGRAPLAGPGAPGTALPGGRGALRRG